MNNNFKNQNNMEKHIYKSPLVEVIDVEVEQDIFTLSGVDTDDLYYETW